MGLFNSLHSQYERLNHAMDDQKTFSLGAAAAVMRVRRERVDAQLVRSRKEGCAVVYSINREIWPRIRALLDVLCAEMQQKGEKHE